MGPLTASGLWRWRHPSGGRRHIDHGLRLALARGIRKQAEQSGSWCPQGGIQTLLGSPAISEIRSLAAMCTDLAWDPRRHALLVRGHRVGGPRPGVCTPTFATAPLSLRALRIPAPRPRPQCVPRVRSTTWLIAFCGTHNLHQVPASPPSIVVFGFSPRTNGVTSRTQRWNQPCCG